MIKISRLFFILLFCVSDAIALSVFKDCEQSLLTPQLVLASGWSNDLEQTRRVDKSLSGISAEDLTELELKWSFVFDNAVHPRSIAAVSEQAIFLADEQGSVMSLDRETGCGYWRYRAEAEVRTALTIATVENQQLVFFGDQDGYAYALNAVTGEQVWKKRMDDHHVAMITGSPVFYEGLLYVPISSFETAHALNPFYSCCTFRGAIHAVEASTGETVWKTHTISGELKKTGRNIIFVRQYGPSGAPIWSSPTIDKKRGVLYTGSGQNYSSPADDGSDAIMSMDLKTGQLLWKRQMQAKDAWNAACMGGFSTNCPDEDGDDFDFGAPPILTTNTAGKDLILAGQKSGMVYALDPDAQGALLWSRKVGRGGILGGVHWGMAADNEAVYVPISDADLLGREFPGEPKPSMSKIDINTGEIIWQTKVNFDCQGVKGCRNGLSAAVTLIDGAVLAPGLDGVIHAYDSNTGLEIWHYDTKREFKGINGVTGKGGTLDAGGVVVVDGLMLSNSGYGGIVSAGGLKGDVFLVFSLPVKPSLKTDGLE